MTKIVGMLVFCRNASGAPEIYQTIVQCTQARFDEGGHYDLAMSEAALRGYEPVLAADEHDPAYKQFHKGGPQERSASAAGGKAVTRYVCDVKVEDPGSGTVDTLEVHVDEVSGAMFAVDATYLDQVSDRGVSPYTGQDIWFAEPGQRPEDGPSALRVAIAERDLLEMVGELQAGRLELVECYRWASTQGMPLRQSQIDSLKARSDSIDRLLSQLTERLPSCDADLLGGEIGGQIVSVCGDQADPDQEVLVEVYAFIQGGVLQSVTASAPVKVTVVDYDVYNGDGERLVAIPDQGAGHGKAEVSEMPVNVDPSACAVLAEVIAQTDCDSQGESRSERGG